MHARSPTHAEREIFKNSPDASEGSDGDRLPLRVVIADDHAIVREGVSLFLKQAGVDVLGTAATGRDSIEMSLALEPDVLVLDLNLPDRSGLEVLRKIKEARPAIRVVILTAGDDAALLSESILSGADGFVSKDVSPARLRESLRLASGGTAVIDRQLLQTALEEPAAPAPASPRSSDHALIRELTDREVLVLRLLAEGKSNDAIAENLVVSRNTVKTHVRNIYQKLGTSDRTQAAIWAVRAGIAS